MASEKKSTETPGRYWLHGFEMESALELPALSPAGSAEGAADVVLRFGRTPERIENPRQQGVCFQADPGEMLCWMPGAGRFQVVGGKTMTVEAEPGVSMDTLRDLALSSPMAALLLQRQLLPLHASAVATPRGAVVFAAGTGLGKSTLAAELGRRGFGILADDLTALHVCDQDGVGVLAGQSGVRLWPDSIKAVGLDGPGAGAGAEWVKHPWVLGDRLLRERLPVAAIYILDRGEAPPGAGPLIRFSGAEALSAVLDLVYRPAFVRGLGLERQVFSQAAAAVKTARVMQLIAPADRFAPTELAQRVLTDLGL